MIETIVIQEPLVRVEAAQPGLPGPPGPKGDKGDKGQDGLGAISLDAGNAIRQGSDGGLFCPAVLAGAADW